MQLNSTRAGIFTLMKLHEMLFSLTNPNISFVSKLFLLYRNEDNGLSTFSAQATMTESGIKHADAGWQERITAKEIGDEKPCYSTKISIFSFIWAGLAAIQKQAQYNCAKLNYLLTVDLIYCK